MAILDSFDLKVSFDFSSMSEDKNPEFLFDWLTDLGLFPCTKNSLAHEGSGDAAFANYIASQTTDSERCDFELVGMEVYGQFTLTFSAKGSRSLLDKDSRDRIESFLNSCTIHEEAFVTKYRLRKMNSFYQRLHILTDNGRIGKFYVGITDEVEALENEVKAFAATVPAYIDLGFQYTPETDD